MTAELRNIVSQERISAAHRASTLRSLIVGVAILILAGVAFDRVLDGADARHAPVTPDAGVAP